VTPERRRELKQIYRQAVRGADQDTTTFEWRRFLAALYLEGGDLRIFQELRARARGNGARLDQEYLDDTITKQQLVRGLKVRCAERYAQSLNRYGLAEIDIETPAFRQIIRTLGPEVLETFDSVDPESEHEACRAMAKTWHRLVQLVHAEYGLPRPRALRARLGIESDAERDILEEDDFEARMSPAKRAAWEAVIG
jgi:hypothetical protein